MCGACSLEWKEHSWRKTKRPPSLHWEPHINGKFFHETQCFFSQIGKNFSFTVAGADKGLGSRCVLRGRGSQRLGREQYSDSPQEPCRSSTCKSLSPEKNRALWVLHADVYHSDVYNREKLETT